MSSLYTKKFQSIIDAFGYKDFHSSFDVKKNKKAIENSGESDGGAGGEFFLMTKDKQFVIKTINKDEERVFSQIIQSYSEYLVINQNSFIGKILGFFVFEFKKTNQSI